VLGVTIRNVDGERFIGVQTEAGDIVVCESRAFSLSLAKLFHLEGAY
jgi:hypothetical protein